MNELSILKQKKQVILQGAPGTGKTYRTAELAVALHDGYLPETRQEVMERYQELILDKHILFTTFHQSVDYEEFIEGIKPDKDAFTIKDGLFKAFCKQALLSSIRYTDPLGLVLKFENLYQQLLEDVSKCPVNLSMKSEGTIQLEQITDMQNILYSSSNSNHKRKISKTILQKLYIHFQTQACFKGIINIDAAFGQVAKISNTSGYWAILNYFFEHDSKAQICHVNSYNTDIDDTSNSVIQAFLSLKKEDRALFQTTPYIVIIDEINRGNVSKIFGELVTLLEKDKRIEAENEITVTLPYSGELFGIPDNLYIIGTMNTADRSVGYLDYAIRRRFAFITLKADRNVIACHYEDKKLRQKALDYFDRVESLLEVSTDINKDDIMIGHSYFLAQDEEELLNKIKYEVRPLLMEYLNDGLIQLRKNEDRYQTLMHLGEEETKEEE